MMTTDLKRLFLAVNDPFRSPSDIWDLIQQGKDGDTNEATSTAQVGQEQETTEEEKNDD